MAFGARDVTLLVKVLADTAKASSDLDSFASKTKSTGGVVKGLAVPAGIAIGAIGVFGATAVDAASDVEQALGGLKAVFKGQEKAATDLARNSADAAGLSTAEYAQMATVIGAQLKNMGVAQKDLLPTTTALITKGSDLAAQYGGSTADAVTALSALLRGERDPIERYGVSIKQAGVDAAIGADALKGMTAEQKTAAQTTATLAILTKQTADATGAFSRESDTAAHAQQVANASWTNAQAALGEALLPALVVVSDVLTAFSGFLMEHKTIVLVVVGAVGALAAGILALNIAMKVARAATMAMQAATWLLNSALFANPIGLVVLAILALIAVFVVAYNKSETFRRIVDSVFAAVVGIVRSAIAIITSIFAKLGEVLAGPFRFFQSIVTTVIAAVKAAIRGLASFVTPIFNAIKAAVKVIKDGIAAVKKAIDHLPKLPQMPWDNSKSAPPRSVLAPAPSLTALGRTPRAGLPATSSFGSQVTLVLDREVFGRATISSLRRYDRRNGPAQVLPRWA